MKKEEVKPEKFDYRTSIRDPKTGNEIGRQDYKLEIKEISKGNSSYKLERPIGSGQFFNPDGSKIEIIGDLKKEVPIDAEGKTQEEFDREQATKNAQEKSKKHN